MRAPSTIDTAAPGRPRCLLAGIEGIESFTRLVLRVRDRTGRLVTVGFYTDDRGAQVKGPLLKKGDAVAILYPEKHYFMDGSTGVRAEEDDMVKALLLRSWRSLDLADAMRQIFPTSLDGLLRLNDDIQRWSKNDKPSCQGCGQEKEPFQNCKGCGLCSYCSKVCEPFPSTANAKQYRTASPLDRTRKATRQNVRSCGLSSSCLSGIGIITVVR